MDGRPARPGVPARGLWRRPDDRRKEGRRRLPDHQQHGGAFGARPADHHGPERKPHRRRALRRAGELRPEGPPPCPGRRGELDDVEGRQDLDVPPPDHRPLVQRRSGDLRRFPLQLRTHAHPELRRRIRLDAAWHPRGQGFRRRQDQGFQVGRRPHARCAHAPHRARGSDSLFPPAPMPPKLDAGAPRHDPPARQDRLAQHALDTARRAGR